MIRPSGQIYGLRGEMSDSDLTANKVFEEIRTLLEPYNPNAVDIKMDTDLASELNVDSVAAMTLVMEIEDIFEFDIPLNLLPDLNSPGDLVEVVLSQSNS